MTHGRCDTRVHVRVRGAHVPCHGEAHAGATTTLQEA